METLVNCLVSISHWSRGSQCLLLPRIAGKQVCIRRWLAPHRQVFIYRCPCISMYTKGVCSFQMGRCSPDLSAAATTTTTTTATVTTPCRLPSGAASSSSCVSVCPYRGPRSRLFVRSWSACLQLCPQISPAPLSASSRRSVSCSIADILISPRRVG